MARYRTQAFQRGVALLTALVLMLAVLMTSIAAARSAIHGARSAQHERERMQALQGAMAALVDAEQDIDGGSDPASARAAALANGNPAAFAAGCRGGTPYDGLCTQAADPGDIAGILADDEGPAVPLGSHTGAHMPAGEGALAARWPRYLIELLPSSAGTLLYRISTLGFGSADSAQVALQAYYLKVLPTGAQGQGTTLPGNLGNAPAGTRGSPGGPGILVGWREIANWRDIAAGEG